MGRLTNWNISHWGQELGNADGTIAKITNDRIMLTDANGYLLTLPLNYVPEVDPEEKRRAAEAARQPPCKKPPGTNAAAEAAGNVDVDVPGPGYGIGPAIAEQ